MLCAYTEPFNLKSSFSFGIYTGKVYETLDGKYSKLSDLSWEEPIAIDLSIEERFCFFQFYCNYRTKFNYS